METNNFKGKFNYTYIETGYNEQDFNKVYDAKTRSIDCVLKLPDENNKYVIEMEFETPDGNYKDFVSSDLKNIVLNGSDLLYLGIHFKEYTVNEKRVKLIGDFVLEIRDEIDGYHMFNFSVDFDNADLISIIKKENLLNKKINLS